MNTPDPKSPPQGDTLPRVKDDPSPRLPHERDESSDSQTVEKPRQKMKQAQADLERGLVDTDKSPVIDEVYQRTARGPEPANPGKPRS